MLGSSSAVADAGVGDTPLVPIRHPLDVHDFLVIAPVVVHHAEKRDAVMRSRPQRSRRIHEIAILLDADREPAMLAVSERCAHGRGQIASFGRDASLGQ